MKLMERRRAFAVVLVLMVPINLWAAKALDPPINTVVAQAESAGAERRFRQISPATQRYYTAIRDKISRHWVQPNGLAKPRACHAEIYQTPGGVILDVRIVDCPGPEKYQRSVEQAILKSDPLPAPQNAEDFHAKIHLVFKPE